MVFFIYFVFLIDRNLSHKNLVKLLGVSLDGSPIYIVTEFCGKVISSILMKLLLYCSKVSYQSGRISGATQFA